MWLELMTVVGSFVGTAFALVRYSLGQNRAMTDRFMGFLESSIVRQERINEGFRIAIDNLTTSVRENSHLLARVSERLQGGNDAVRR